MKILAGDIGGTNSRLALCSVEDGRVERVAETVYRSSQHDSLEDIVRDFISRYGVGVRVACFGLPGPVRGRRAELTNLPWIVDADNLERRLGFSSVTLLNDLEANAHGLATLAPDDFCVLREGTPEFTGNAGLMSAGTGLGEAGLCWDGRALIPFATEGGHTAFSPSNELEIDLLRFLQQRVGTHVSWERVVSGMGIVNIYEFFKSRRPGCEPAWLAEEMAAEGDAARVISINATAGKSELCRDTLDLFLELYGAEAANLALKLLATRGIYLGGGIVPQLTKEIVGSNFLTRFDDKGRMRQVVEQIPIKIVLNDKAALQGAAYYAARYAGAGHD